jgi:hypothetical protein
MSQHYLGCRQSTALISSNRRIGFEPFSAGFAMDRGKWRTNVPERKDVIHLYHMAVTAILEAQGITNHMAKHDCKSDIVLRNRREYLRTG